MALPTSTSSVSYAGNGSTSTLYPVPFVFFLPTDLSVYKVVSGVSTLLVNGTDYTVTGGGFGSTGNIATSVAYPSTTTIIINRNVPYVQATSLTTGDEFPAVSMEQALDNVVMQTQQLSRNTLPDTSTAAGTAPFVLQASAPGASPTWVPQSSGSIAAGAITNTMLAGGITPAKLSTGGPTWDASGNLTATSFVGPVTGAVTGNASTATKLAAAKTIGLSGDITGTATSFDGSGNITISTTVSAISGTGVVGTTALAANAVTAAKLGTNEQKQIAKAWVNFAGTTASGSGATYVRTGNSVVVTWSSSNFFVGQQITVSAATDTGLNGTATITAVTGTNFTFSTVSTGTATGSLTFSGLPFIRSSYNVSSVTKNGTGDYTVNFATAMADANYSAICIGSNENGGIAYSLMGASAITSTSVRINAARPGVGNTDQSIMCVQIFGN